MGTKIEWTNETWNPMTGCNGCSLSMPDENNKEHCYAKKMAQRLKGRFGYPADDPFKVTLHADRLSSDHRSHPMQFKKSRMFFVCSMGDLFCKDVPDEFIIEVFAIMNKCQRHTFQVLTKRPERLVELQNRLLLTDNIWVGVSIEDFARRTRASQLAKVSSKIKFISFEPLLGGAAANPEDDLILKATGINWVIVGGETGAGARPMDKGWVANIHAICDDAGVPFFFKGWGTATMKKTDPGYYLYNGKEWREMPRGC